MSNYIELRPSDLQFKELDDGRIVTELKANLAFDESFREECKSKGVKNKTIRIEEPEEEEEEEEEEE